MKNKHLYIGVFCMLPIERKKQIEKLICEREHLKISELSEIFNVSEMTIHRDLTPLIDEGKIIKTFGGVTCAQSIQRQQQNTCVYCYREYQKHLAYRIVLNNDITEIACCAHCGLLRYRQREERVVQLLARDFLRHTTINAKKAFYVLNTSLHINCCQPQVLTFEWEDHAKKFTKGFGGDIYPFHEALTIIYEQMI